MYYPYTQMIRWAKGTSLRCAVKCETYDVPGYAIDDMNQYGGFEGVETIQAAAALDEEKGEMHLFVINADLEEGQLLTGDLKGFGDWRLAEHTALYADHPDDRCTWEHPDGLAPRTVPGTVMDKGVLTAVLQPASWNVLRFVKAHE